MLDLGESHYHADRPLRLAIFSNLFICAMGFYCLLIKNMDAEINISILNKFSEDTNSEDYDIIIFIVDPKIKCENMIKYIKDTKSKIRKETKFIVISFFDNANLLKDINNLELSGYINIYLDINTIISNLKDIIYNDKKIISTLSDEITKSIMKITPRQLEILNLISKGYTNKEIAKKLGISPFTVRMHISSLIKTLNVPNRYAAVSLAKEFNLI